MVPAKIKIALKLDLVGSYRKFACIGNSDLSNKLVRAKTVRYTVKFSSRENTTLIVHIRVYLPK